MIKRKPLFSSTLGGNLLGNILNKNFADPSGESPSKAQHSNKGWKLAIFEMGKRQYHLFENSTSANYDIPLVPGDETLII